ncbi:MAG TPA: hypothetical protein ENJ19_04920 [Gammaproteobacteria bacterium]|nr:hypothetical protein [Gammaproteobacteria bacterium]
MPVQIKPFAALLCGTLFACSAFAGAPVKKTIEELYQDKAVLSGQQVQVSGEVVKVTNGVMKRNFLHLQDGTGHQGSNDLTVTSQDTAHIGDRVVITGTVATDVDFGMGYSYPLLVEKATIAKAATGH